MSTLNFPYYTQFNNTLNEYTLKQLKQVLRDFPYFQIARVLYLKNIYLLNRADFEEELKKNVPYITDRRLLYELLYDKTIFTSTADVNSQKEVASQIASPDSETIEKQQEIIDREADEKAAQNTKENIPRIPESIKRIFTESMRKNIADLLDFQDEQIKRSNSKEDLTFTSIQLNIEKEYGSQLKLVHTKNTDVPFELEDGDIRKASNEDEGEDIRRISTSVIHARDFLNFEYSSNEEVENEQQIEPLQEEELLDLDALSSDQETTPDEKTETSIEEGGMSFSQWYMKNIQDKSQENNILTDDSDSENQNLDLIERFIQLNPSIKPSGSLEHEQFDISTDSVEENEEYLTDTLARIYVKQERYQKAISVYEKLILKYPEKNTYFANQINEIEKKINN